MQLSRPRQRKVEITLNTHARNQGPNVKAAPSRSRTDYRHRTPRTTTCSRARRRGRRKGSLTARNLKPSSSPLHVHVLEGVTSGTCHLHVDADLFPSRRSTKQCIRKPIPANANGRTASVRRRRQALVLFLDASLKVREAEVIYERRDNRD